MNTQFSGLLNETLTQYFRKLFSEYVGRKTDFAIKAGWFEIIEQFLESMEAIDERIKFDRFREKNGSLLIDVRGGPIG